MLPSDVLNSFPREGRKLIFILSLASNELKDKARPVGMGLFHADQMIATFISSHRKAMQIMHAGATLIVQWIRRWIDNDEAIERMQARQRKDLLETDGWKKERRRQ